MEMNSKAGVEFEFHNEEQEIIMLIGKQKISAPISVKIVEI